jgi:hypothetical protein
MTKTFLICVILVAIVAGAFLAIDPTLADTIYDEDNFFEDFTAVVCIVGLIFSLILVFKRLKVKSGYGFWIFLSVLLFIFAGDEVSWGIPYLGLTEHKIAGTGFDGIHDIFAIAISSVKLVRDYINSIGILDIRSLVTIAASTIILFAVAYFSIARAVKNRERISRFFSVNIKWKPFLFLVLGLALIASAMLIDEDNLINFPHKAVVEESMELLAAVSFVFSCLSGFKEKRDV